MHPDHARIASAYPEDRLQQLGATGADQPGQADDLAASHLKAHRPAGAGDVQAVDLEHDILAGGCDVGEQGAEFATDHGGHDVLVTDGRDRLVHDQTAVAQYHDPVGQRPDLLHLVGGVDHRHALGAQPPDHAVELLDLSLGDRRRRLVQQQDPGPGVGGLDDLDDLLDADRQPAHRRRDVDLDAEVGERGAGGLDHRPPVQQAEPVQLTADEEILIDRLLGDRGKLLRDDRDPGPVGVGDAAVQFVPVDADAPAVCPVLTGGDLQQGRLARPVLTGECRDGAGLEVEADAGQDRHAAEPLGHVPDRQHRRHVASPPHCDLLM